MLIFNLQREIVLYFYFRDEIVSLKNVIEKLSTNAYKTETKTKYEENKDVVSKLISDEKYAFETMNNNIKQDPESVLSLRKKVFQLLLEFIYKLFKIVYNIQLNLL